MRLHVEWIEPIYMRSWRGNYIYVVELEDLPAKPGIYVFGRRWGTSTFEALYVGKANHLRNRVTQQLNNLRLMQHLRIARGGRRMILVGTLITKPGQQIDKCLPIAKRAFTRSFLSEGHDLVN